MNTNIQGDFQICNSVPLRFIILFRIYKNSEKKSYHRLFAKFTGKQLYQSLSRLNYGLQLFLLSTFVNHSPCFNVNIVFFYPNLVKTTLGLLWLSKANSHQIKVKPKSCLFTIIKPLLVFQIGLNRTCASKSICCIGFVKIVLFDMELNDDLIKLIQFRLNLTHFWLMFLFYTF